MSIELDFTSPGPGSLGDICGGSDADNEAARKRRFVIQQEYLTARRDEFVPQVKQWVKHTEDVKRFLDCGIAGKTHVAGWQEVWDLTLAVQKLPPVCKESVVCLGGWHLLPHETITAAALPPKRNCKTNWLTITF